MLDALDDAGLTSIFVDPEYGGSIPGANNLATALAAFELAWVDGGAATCAIALGLALQPIIQVGTDEQKEAYLRGSLPPPGPQRRRGAFCLTEPLPFAGVDTGMLSGKVVVSNWGDGVTPTLRRHANVAGSRTIWTLPTFVVAVVASDEPRIEGTCMVILEKDDPGTFDRGAGYS